MVTLDELLQRDRKREDDGFKRKIRIGKIVKPSKGGKEKIIVVPSTVEENLSMMYLSRNLKEERAIQQVEQAKEKKEML